jgi:hypothetical protein
MEIRADSFRRISLLITIAFLLGARPGNAQTLDTSLVAEDLRPANEVILDHESAAENPKGITNEQRLRWFIEKTIGPRSLVAGIASAGIGTGLGRPREYGATGHGFDRRYEMRLAGLSTGNAMEATLGAIWGEDPRYHRVPNEPFGGRVRNIVKMTFVACRNDGSFSPAYARYIGISGSNFLANSWRAHSEANFHDAVLRTFIGFLGRMGSNTVQEFWPDVKRRIFPE